MMIKCINYKIFVLENNITFGHESHEICNNRTRGLFGKSNKKYSTYCLKMFEISKTFIPAQLGCLIFFFFFFSLSRDLNPHLDFYKSVLWQCLLFKDIYLSFFLSFFFLLGGLSIPSYCKYIHFVSEPAINPCSLTHKSRRASLSFLSVCFAEGSERNRIGNSV